MNIQSNELNQIFHLNQKKVLDQQVTQLNGHKFRKLDINDLPSEVLEGILVNLDYQESAKFCSVSKLWDTLMFKNRFQMLLTILDNPSICQKLTMALLESNLKKFLVHQDYKEQLFLPLMKILGEIGDIRANVLFRFEDNRKLKIFFNEMNEFLIQHYGLVAYFHSFIIEAILGHSRFESKESGSAPFVLLESLLRSGQGVETLELVNTLINHKILPFEAPLTFKDGQLILKSLGKFHSLEEAINLVGSDTEINLENFKKLIAGHVMAIKVKLGSPQLLDKSKLNFDLNKIFYDIRNGSRDSPI